MDEKYFDNYSNYQQLTGQSETNVSVPQNYSHYQSQNSYSNKPALLDMYSTNVCRNQDIPHFNNTLLDPPTWENRVLPNVEKILNMSEKVEMIELSSKDLSIASFTMNNCPPDSYKFNKETNHYGNQWYYNHNLNTKVYDYPSCAQVGSTYPNNHSRDNLDNSTKTVMYNDSVYHECDKFYKPANSSVSYVNSSDYNFTGYDRVQENTDFFHFQNFQFEPINTPIDQQTEGSHEESDIIVEASDDEVTDYSEDQERRPMDPMNRCLICNIAYTPLGTQFYSLTNERPLTMSSQKPVITNIIEILGHIFHKQTYICSECLGLLNSIDHLQVNLKKLIHELTEKFDKTCVENNFCKTRDVHHIKRIKKNVIKQTRYRCRICNHILCLKKYFKLHISKHNNRRYLCESCGKVFKSRKMFLLHSKRHEIHTDIVKKYFFKCMNCSKDFRTKSNLKDHENNCLGLLSFECRYCDKRFPTSTKLKNHVKLKHDKKFIAICSICNIGFIKVSDYKSHMVTHSTDKKFSCSKCEKSYKSLSNLNFHMKAHDDKLKLACHICGKGFMRKEYLDAHVNNHNGIKNYRCSICEKKFFSQKSLDSHLKYHDVTITKKSCSICGKVLAAGIQEHMRIHNNLREFECANCDMKFNTKGTLRKHIIKKHSGNC